MKTCGKCGGEPKPITEFHKHARSRDGLQSHCKSCRSITGAASYAEDIEKHRARHAKYRADNPEKCMAASAGWRAATPDRVRANSAEWAADNPEAKRIHRHNRRARKLAVGGKLSKDITKRLLALQRGKCACGCGQPLGGSYHLDHRMPIALGGTNTDDNMQLLRKTCNLQKHAKHPIEFMQSRGFLL